MTMPNFDPGGLFQPYAPKPTAPTPPAATRDNNPDLNAEWVKDMMNDSGWQHGGPTTVEEAGYILDFIKNNGYAPTPKEVANWALANNRDNFHYRDWGTMGDFGWGGTTVRDQFNQAQRKGNVYGPNMGSQTPEGGWLIMENGKPKYRSYDPNDPNVKSGNYINRDLEGMLMELDPTSVNQYKESLKNYYPEYNRQRQGFSLEDTLSIFSNEQVYEAKLRDYLQKEYNTQYDSIQSKVNSGEMTLENANALITALGAQSEQTLNDALNQIGQGVPALKLPLYNEIKDVMGDLTNKLMNQGAREMTQRETNRLKNIPGAGLTPNDIFANIARNLGAKEGTTAEHVTTGDEQSQYVKYVQSLDLAPEFKYYMLKTNTFESLYNEWSKSPNQPFIQWLIAFLKG